MRYIILVQGFCPLITKFPDGFRLNLVKVPKLKLYGLPTFYRLSDYIYVTPGVNNECDTKTKSQNIYVNFK